MAFQSRSVIAVLRGVDWGWPATRRGSDKLGLAESLMATRFVVAHGLAGVVAAPWAVPGLLPWLLPVLVPMIAAPVLVSWTSRPAGGVPLFLVPAERDLPEILRRHDAVVERWTLTDWPLVDWPLADGSAAVGAGPVRSAGHPATGPAQTAHAPA
jgi:membrane glycosyltransferase